MATDSVCKMSVDEKIARLKTSIREQHTTYVRRDARRRLKERSIISEVG